MNDETPIPSQALMDQRDILQMRLAELRQRHRRLDDEIAELSRAVGADTLSLKFLKQQKLRLRDRIVAIEDMLTPDIIA